MLRGTVIFFQLEATSQQQEKLLALIPKKALVSRAVIIQSLKQNHQDSAVCPGSALCGFTLRQESQELTVTSPVAPISLDLLEKEGLLPRAPLTHRSPRTDECCESALVHKSALSPPLTH